MTMSVISSFTIGDIEVGHDIDITKPVDDQLGVYKVSGITLDKKMLQPNELRFTLRRDKVERTDKTIQFPMASDILSKKVECTVETFLKGVRAGQIGDHEVKFKGTVVSATLDGLDIH